MMKRILIVVLIVLLAGGAGYLYLSRNEISFSRDSSLYKAVPVTAPFFLEFNSLKSVPTKNPVLYELEKAGIWKNFFSFSQNIDSLIQITEGLPSSLRDTRFLLSIGFSGRNDLVPLLVVKAESNNRITVFKNLLNTVYPSASFSYQSKEYGNNTITEIVNATGETSVFYSFAEELLLISSKSLLVEQAIRQLPTRGILKNNYFQEVISTPNLQSGVSFFVNHKHFPVFAGQFLNGSTHLKVDEFGETRRVNVRREIESFADFASWSAFAVQFDEHTFSLNGNSAADDSLHHFLTVFADQEPVRFSAEDILPGNTSFFCSFAFSEKESFFNRLDEYFTYSDFYYTREERMTRFDRGFRADVRKSLREIVKNEIIVASTSVPVDPSQKTTYFILQTEGLSEARDQLLTLLKNYTARRDITTDELKSTVELDEETVYEVYKFPYPSFPFIWLGHPFGLSDAGFVTFFDDYLIFSNSEQGIRDYLRSMMLGATLTRNSRYQRFRKNNSARANIHIFTDVNQAFGFKNELFSDNILKKVDAVEENLRKFGAVSWQMQRDKNGYYNSVVAGFYPNAPERAQTAWQSNIGSNIINKPQIVVNHHNLTNREIIIQDENYNLHQVTGEGRVRWTVQLPGPILGAIHQIDYYENGNLQYLFNTKEKLYLIDREGNNVAHFPVEFESPATNGVNVFDYHNNRDYRYFVALENRKVVAYDKSAAVVAGWVFQTTESQVTTPVQHFRIGTRDYIVFKDKSKIYIQNRRGETRVETSAWFENSGNPLFLDLNGTPKIVTTDATGQVHYIYFNGEHEEKETDSFGEDHFFVVDDLEGDAVPDFVFVDGNQLVVMDENGKKQFSEKFENAVIHPPNIYTFGPELKKVGVVEATSSRIYLFNPDGELHTGFPLQGNTEFSIGKLSDSDSGLSLVVGSEGGKLYNYTIE